MKLTIDSADFENLNSNVGAIATELLAICMAGINTEGDRQAIRSAVFDEFTKRSDPILNCIKSAQCCLHDILDKNRQ